MNINEMLSQMSPEMLSKGLSQLSRGLSADQLRQAQDTIKNSGIAKDLGNVDIKTLQQNPQKLKELAANKELISQLQAILNKKSN